MLKPRWRHIDQHLLQIAFSLPCVAIVNRSCVHEDWQVRLHVVDVREIVAWFVPRTRLSVVMLVILLPILKVVRPFILI